MESQIEVGDIVDVKGHGRATVLEPLIADLSHPQFGRYLVQYHEDSTTFYCNAKKLRKIKLSSSRVVVCFRTEHYRAAAVHNVERRDVCLEVGCHNGTTTRILHNRCTFVVGVDNVVVAVEEARERLPHVRFEVADGFNIEQLHSFSPTGSYDKIFVDISGKAPLPLITRMLSLYLEGFPQSTIVVKNEALFSFLEQLEQQQAGQRAGHVQQPDAQQRERISPPSAPSQQQPQQQPRQDAPLQRPAQYAQQVEQQQVQEQGASQGASCSCSPVLQEFAAKVAVAVVPADDSLASLASQCELFREKYISHSLKQVAKRSKWVGRKPEAVGVAGRTPQ